LSADASYKIGDKYKSVLVKYGKKLAMSLKYTLMQEIVIASPRAKKMVIINTGIAHNISNEKLEPTIALIIKNTIKVGRNLKIAITTAEIGNIIRGKAVLRISRCPAVIDLTPPVKELATK
jgi:CheY-specific phosphatase CheX